MASVFVVKEDGRSEPMTPVLCKDEDKELQRILENNFDLLPGEQLAPESPCHWMLIKREMPVPDPSTGAPRWSIDFFFVDQDATPTFVECKRYLNTQSRREVVGQVLEYAANAKYYWSAPDIRAHAEVTAKARGESLEDGFRSLESGIADDLDSFFGEVERRLKSGDVRLVFFLEQAPAELKRLVEFLNSEMASVEVMLVEAKQYRQNGLRIVVPTLFGFTEQIREIKRANAAERDRKAVAFDWESFKANASDKGLPEGTIAAIRKLYDACKILQADIVWGRGTVTGSFSPKWASICPTAAPFSVFANGNLGLHFPAFHKTETAESFRKELAAEMTKAGFKLPEAYTTNWFEYEAEDWAPKVASFIGALNKAIAAQTNGVGSI